MKTLYISDLDGTLLHSDQHLSQYSVDTLNAMLEKGLLFSYATARSSITSRKACHGLNARFPLIVYNGAFVIDNVSGELLLSNFFDDDAIPVLNDLLAHDVFPIVYSYQNGIERFSYMPDCCSKGVLDFVASRPGDPRTTAVTQCSHLYNGNIFYFTCIDEKEKLTPLYEKYKDKHHCIFHKDIYSGEQWLEIMPQNACKANACRQLKELLGCERLVVFGDGTNDMDMFHAADYSCAVSNAVKELQLISDEIIGSNDDDGVVKWIEQDWKKE